jgi:hypothetical protein
MAFFIFSRTGGLPTNILVSKESQLFFTVMQGVWSGSEIGDALLTHFDNRGRDDETTPDNLYSDFCLAQGSSCCVYPGVEFENEDIFPRIVNYVLGCIVEHTHDQEAQQPARVMLRHFVGEDAVKKLAEYTELRHCQDAYYAMAA